MSARFRAHGGYPYSLGCLDGRKRNDGDGDSTSPDRASCCFVATVHEQLSALTVRSAAARANPIGLDGLSTGGTLPTAHRRCRRLAGCRSPGTAKVMPYPRRLLLAHAQQASDGLAEVVPFVVELW